MRVGPRRGFPGKTVVYSRQGYGLSHTRGGVTEALLLLRTAPASAHHVLFSPSGVQDAAFRGQDRVHLKSDRW